MQMPVTITELLEAGNPQAPAILATGGRPALTYAGLRNQVAKTARALHGLGIGRNDPVAIVLPNGPEMATAFVSIACGATVAPLNPGYRAEELRFYLSDLGARLLVVAQGMETAATDVAQALRIPMVRLLVPQSAPAGVFDLDVAAAPGSDAARAVQADDVALVLHTSGTTSRPKIVPLTHRNVCVSAVNIARSLALTPADVCLNIMPLFHIHGLIGAVLSSLAAGASVACTPGFDALRFFAHLQEIKPTWYTAVPTMHQAILGRAARNEQIIRGSRLRFIRSSSASLPPRVMAELERVFGVPVIEAYGMTEAAHQMASNPLPPRRRKPGSVGVAAGPEIAIMDESGQLLPAGQAGEIVVRGANVIAGYRGNPAANQVAFVDGWFRTGDQGVLDEEGYLRITGRLKEIINRGGEKISPREIDEALMDHPAVAQAVTFAIPHEKLGEDVGAAVVLEAGASVSERELQHFLRQRLAGMKVPRRIVILEEIPRGATGKLQRVGLAEKLGLT